MPPVLPPNAVLYNRGTAYMYVREDGKAIEDFSAVIEADPENLGAYMTRGFVLSNLERHEEAARDYGRLVELAPDDPSIRRESEPRPEQEP